MIRPVVIFSLRRDVSTATTFCGPSFIVLAPNQARILGHLLGLCFFLILLWAGLSLHITTLQGLVS